ncbi:MAG: ferritin family protein [Desulfobacula sp.]|jgi:rubrerythrin|uniref:ferritin family protein n=1 Tax=Desulfobacula sp. TaxID=2593537 RepID=UPI001D7BAB0A|nr:ferritin family protein [Desulfobacula sp.]MBT3387518.1 ferritin family protein [Desulfobacula sp.]MBT3487094.1 ferritin family protein [Desulfobacula sp.]MBT3805801.1 ferritin family protein [Desulfobacula sp.]MBT4024759.1 ferritin family protein [Desulfobacula sp.]
MDKSNTLTILKNAFLIERKGKSLYEKAMDHAKDEAVKDFFKDLANDELEHMNILEKQFKALMKDGKFMAGGFENDGGAITAPDILDESLKDKINAASFEATAITAAISFEQKAIKMYSEREKEAIDPEEKKMYHWLSVWEKTHLKKLMALEASLIENIWNDNSFWPF